MSLIQRLRRIVRDDHTGDGPRPYRCLACGERFELQRQTCPVCGGYRIERTDWTAPAE